MQENYIYPVKIRKEERGNLLIVAPDFPEQITEAENERDAIVGAQEMLAICIMDNEDRGKMNPVPTEVKEILLEDGEKLVHIHVWMPYFRNIRKEVYVKKTLTIPNWLDIQAKEKNINFSATLVKGLKQELGIENR